MSDGFEKVSDCLRGGLEYFRKVSDSLRKASCGLEKMQDGLRKVSDGLAGEGFRCYWETVDGFGKVSDGLMKVPIRSQELNLARYFIQLYSPCTLTKPTKSKYILAKIFL